MSIFDVMHQPQAHRLVQRALTAHRTPHAYVFHGPEGVGRELFAHRLAKLLLCEKPIHRSPADVPGFDDWSDALIDACNACDACRFSEASTHPDLHLIHRELIKQHPDPTIRARKGLDLGIDVLREFVIKSVANKPSLGRAKVFIIRETEKMTVAAQNALLKTLEEPPATTFLMLIVSSIDALLPTTKSRCQMIPFGPLPTSFIVDGLRSADESMAESEATLCAAFANGSLGLAQRYHADRLIEFNARITETLCDLQSAGVTELAKRMIEHASELGDVYKSRDKDISDTEAKRRGLKTLLLLASMWYRSVLHRCVGADVAATDSRDEQRLQHAASSFTPRRAGDAIRSIVTAERQLDLNVNVQLCLESLLIRLARLTAA